MVIAATAKYETIRYRSFVIFDLQEARMIVVKTRYPPRHRSICARTFDNPEATFQTYSMK